MNTKTQEALKMAGFELDGVIADIKLSGKFDCVSYDTVVRVRKTIADYVAPSWKGLSDDEIDAIIQKHDGVFGSVVRAIEQALKEKNT